MSTESLNRTSAITSSYPEDTSEDLNTPKKKVNIEVLKKRVFLEKKGKDFKVEYY